jgi:AmpE protein
VAISVIIICLLLQRWLCLEYGAFRLPLYYKTYFRWLYQSIEHIAETYPVISVLIFILPLVIVSTLLFVSIYHVLGVVGYCAISFVMMWLSVDAQRVPLKNEEQENIENLFISIYQRFFGPVFWYIILGPTGLVLYTAVSSLQAFLTGENHLKLLQYVVNIKNYLDWIPLRLIGFSFALMGNFAIAFKSWIGTLWQVSMQEQAMIKFGVAALTYSEQEQSFNTAIKLIDRVILFWLIVIAFFTLEFWLG